MVYGLSPQKVHNFPDRENMPIDMASQQSIFLCSYNLFSFNLMDVSILPNKLTSFLMPVGAFAAKCSLLILTLLTLSALFLMGASSASSAASAAPASPSSPANSTDEAVEIQLLALNDFHGQLEPPSGMTTLYYNSTGAPFRQQTGGAAFLATLIRALKATNPNTVIVSAGDCVGASPLVSAVFQDEPTIEALGEMGLEYSAAGNHEFDNGVAELQRKQYGCSPQAGGCREGDNFAGAGYHYLTANVISNSTGKTLFPAYQIKSLAAVQIAFIGVALKDTPTVVSPSGVTGYTFRDEADSINEVVAQLKNMGIKAIVVLIHNGGWQDGLPNECRNFTGPIGDIVRRSDDEVDLFVTGHTHQAYITTIDGRIVSQAGAQGKFLTDIDLLVSKETGDVISATARNIAVTGDMPQDPDVSEIVDRYKKLSDPLAQEVVGSITSDINRAQSPSGESALGDVIADTQLYAGRHNGSVVAFMNSGGIRTDLFYNPGKDEGPGNVTYGEAFSIQPFGNSIYTMSLTGSQIDELLEEQFDNPTPGQNSILQVSRGFNYTWNASAPHGSRVDFSSIRIDGKGIDAAASYRVAANGFLADGGDNFAVFKEGDGRVCGVGDVTAFLEYFMAFSPVPPGKADRISVTGG